jgi:hypothetical protein
MPHEPDHKPLTEEEKIARWKAGETDINLDGGTNVLDIVLAKKYETSEGADQSIISQSNVVDKVLSPPTQGGVDAQTVALPSVPSISNAGSIPFTGTVSNIPGGFQPIPQTAGGRKKLYQLSQFHGGVNKKSSPRDISDNECQEATNVLFSSIGALKTLGDIKGTDNSISFTSIDVPDKNSAGYGLFEFIAPASIDGTVGETAITVSSDGNRLDVDDFEGATSAFFNLHGSGSDINDHDTAVVYYASGNGIYACDANFAHTNNIRKAGVYVNRVDAGSNTVTGWTTGKALIDSPTYNSDADASMAAGTVKCMHVAGTATPHGSTTAGHGSLIAKCDPNGTGTWNGTYFFYISWFFDGGVETGLTSFADDGGTNAASNGIAFSDEALEFNLSISHENSKPLGADKRIEGARIYFKKSTDNERFLLAEFNMTDGVKGALDSTFQPWTESGDIYSLSSNIIFENPPEIYTYASLNGYYANEVYGESKDSLSSGTTGPVSIDVRYKSSVVGSGGIVYIGNVKFNNIHMPDSMMYSMQGKPGVFPQYNRFDSPSSDGSPIRALASYQDKILQFKENGMYVINVSNPNQFYAEASFRDCGVHNPCQVFTTSFGVIFANKFGCYIYDGRKVISLTEGKLGTIAWGLPEDEASSILQDGAGVPCVGYDPRSQNIIVLKDINDDSADTSGWVYNMTTQSWTDATQLITNADGNRHTNFIITSKGYLSILRDDNQTLNNYKQGNNAQIFIYQTKDLDFGLPSQTKKLFKVYVTFKGNPANVGVSYFTNGGTTEYHFNASSWSNATTLAVATFTPDVSSEAKDWKSISILFTTGDNTVATDFEIQDISILYRARPIK